MRTISASTLVFTSFLPLSANWVGRESLKLEIKVRIFAREPVEVPDDIAIHVSDEDVLKWCHKMYHDYTTGFIDRDTGYFHCRRALAGRSISLHGYVEGGTCWFCGCSVAPSKRNKHCDICGAEQRACFLGVHQWYDAHMTQNHRYQECFRCHKRRIRVYGPNYAYEPVQQDWTLGARWNDLFH